MSYKEIAPYLEDPLVLIGFVVFVGFLFVRSLIKHGIIPPLPSGKGFQILKLILHYGFIIGLLIIVLGFGLKYKEHDNDLQRELTKQKELKLKQQILDSDQQANAYNLFKTELNGNIEIIGELAQNVEIILNNQIKVAKSLRSEGIEILATIFPAENIATGKKKIFEI